jgi:zinc-ribbon domain
MSKGDPVTFCAKCGASLDESALFCGACGEPRPVKAPVKDSENELEKNQHQTYPYELYPEVEMEPEEAEPEYAQVPQAKRRNGVIWGVVIATIVVGGLILAKVNNSENAAFLASVTSSSGADSSQTPQPVDSSTPEPKATKASTSPTPKPSPKPSSKPTPKPSSKPSPKKIDQCAISDQTVSDIVEFKNLIQLIPAGRNDASHKATILQWVDRANANADAIQSDLAASEGKIVGAMSESAGDLSSLATLAEDWANNNLSDPASFPTQYGNAATAVRSDYSKMSSICGDKLP